MNRKRLLLRTAPFAAFLALGCAPADDGGTADIGITPFVGASVQLEYEGTVIHVDPFSRGDYSDALPADLILVTDTPADHLDPALIAELRKRAPPWWSPTGPRTRATRDRASASSRYRTPPSWTTETG